MNNKGGLKVLQGILMAILIIEFAAFSFLQISENKFKSPVIIPTGHAVGNENSCAPDWRCSEWSACLDNFQIRSCVDYNICGTNENKPIERQSCGVPCTPDWQCDSWTPETCENTTTQTRTCTDANLCNSLETKPAEVQTCAIERDFSWVVTFIIIIVVIFIVGTIILLVQKIK